MTRSLDQLTSATHDLLVIGGGINGAAISHLAAKQGLKVALVEKNDFASGTSSKSSKLIHGGLRYLENFEFGLVGEALKERTIQLNAAPHLVKSLGFIIPLFKKSPRPAWMMKLGVSLYDILSGRHVISPHRVLTKEEVRHFIPSIKEDGLIGGIIYFDAQMDDARLCLENVLKAQELGAVVENYVQVKNFIKENGKTVGVTAQDRLTNRTIDIRAKRFVSAVGVWSDELMFTEGGVDNRRIRMTKGVHFICRRRISEHALLLQTKDERIFFVIPYMGETLVGTTDTDYDGKPDDVSVQDKDIEYLLTEVDKFFPSNPVTKEDIVTTFAGLRPLVSQTGDPSSVSRRHVIRESFSGIIYVMGGKYTTYRKIAQDAMKVILKSRNANPDNDFKLFGKEFSQEESMHMAKKYTVSADVIFNLQETYGARYEQVLELAHTAPQLKERIYPDKPIIAAQIVYSLKNEKAQNREDVFDRRLNLRYLGGDFNHFNDVFNKVAP